MAQVDTSPEGLLRILGRLTREYGETAAANFALDEQLNLAIDQVSQLMEMVVVKDKALADFHEQVAEMGKQLDQFRVAADPENAHRYVRAKRAPRPKKNP